MANTQEQHQCTDKYTTRPCTKSKSLRTQDVILFIQNVQRYYIQ